jgi:hypothetical protein
VELGKKPDEFDADRSKQRMAEIALGVQAWPKQWERERKQRGSDPLWIAKERTISRIAALAELKSGLLLLPHVDVRILLCELVNAFPSFAFPNPVELNSYLRFGIRLSLPAFLRG